MIKVNISNNLKRASEMVERDKTIKETLETYGFDYTTGSWSIDGSPLRAGEINKTFAEMGVSEKCYLIGVAKTQNA